MTYRDRRLLNLVLLIVVVAMITVTALAIIITNAIINHWGFFKISLSIGITLIIIGGLGVFGSYLGGYSVSSFAAHARYPEMATVESNYAFKRRQKFPIISIALMALGAIFAGIGLIGIF
ncbi:MAG: hypothetical protein ACTSXO_13045 [Candidatus Heimdallarchaeota archaeon]